MMIFGWIPWGWYIVYDRKGFFPLGPQPQCGQLKNQNCGRKTNCGRKGELRPQVALAAKILPLAARIVMKYCG